MNKKTLNTLVEEYLTELKDIKRASVNTEKAYRKDLQEFVQFCQNSGTSEIPKINERILRLFLLNLNEANLGKSTIARKLSALRSLFSYAIENDIIERNPLVKISNPKIKRTLPEVVELASLQKIYKLCIQYENNKVNALTVQIIFDLLYGCALRVSELCMLKTTDIDKYNKTIRVLGKGNKVRILPLPERTIKLLEEYKNIVERKIPENYLLLNFSGKKLYPQFVYRITKKYLSEVSDIKKKSPHILRHSAATHMLNHNADLFSVKEILGHENLSTTQIYTHLSIERLKESYKKAHPKS